MSAGRWTRRASHDPCPNCRFHPGCSDYAIDALRTHGALRGGALAVRRVLRCNPWNEGGFDPVPKPES